MPTNVTRDTIHKFMDELVECREEYDRMKTVRKDSPLAKLQISTWGGNYFTPVVQDFHSLTPIGGRDRQLFDKLLG